MSPQRLVDCLACHLRLLLECSTNKSDVWGKGSVHLLGVRSGCPWTEESEAHCLLQEKQERVVGSLGCGSGCYQEEEKQWICLYQEAS